MVLKLSEPEERSYEGVQEEKKDEKIIQEGVDARVEEETAAAEALTPIPGKQETITKEKDSEQQEKAKERIKRPAKNKAKSRRKDKEFDITSIAKHLEIQTNHLAKLEKSLQPLRKLAIGLNTQSKMIKGINASVKQLQRQIIQIQKTIQKGKTRRK